jgi:leucyl-tRNA synthetase
VKYNHQKIEKKWQKKWLAERTYEPDLDGAKKPFYNLMMFPYPSAEGLHVGNMYAFTGSDIYGRYERMQGNDVFEPIGLDGFGIHSENYAMKVGTHPADQAKISEKRFYEQLQKIGNGFAWEERLETYDPEYYRWTQWIFVQMWKHGLAYRKKQSVNWCPKDLTVLADEQVVGGRCERCGTEVVKKELEQWSLRITNYADRLLANLGNLDWSEKVKLAQKHWIGKSEGAEIDFLLDFKKYPKENVRRGPNGERAHITIFTTRPDTLFGATFLVLSPEHLWVTLATDDEHDVLLNKAEVKSYIDRVKRKSEAERVTETGEKTGVELKGVKAINPATNEEIPIWVADYVLGSYGEGAIMAVPAHDERDAAFTKKFGLTARIVIEPETGERKPDEQFRRSIVAVVEDPKTGKFLTLNWGPKFGGQLFIGGGIEADEDAVASAMREIKEETGYANVALVAQSERMHHHYFAFSKGVARQTEVTGIHFRLVDGTQEDSNLRHDERGKFVVEWIDRNEVLRRMEDENHILVFRRLVLGEIYDGRGYLMNSGKFDGMDSEKAKWEITKFAGGERKTQFRLRDWLISRQRYWGPPIPMVFCEACAAGGLGERKEMPGWYAVPESELPVVLPYVKDFRPTGSGVSPLATDKKFYETKCPGCAGAARRETDVSDTFLDSAWYYLRYLDPKNNTAALNDARSKKWLPVGMYIGGAEHAVLHLLYVRFVAMALHDWGLLDFEEPFKKFRAHGLVIKDGAKMSKSKGNVINPDDYVANFGADTLRMYLMFMAPFEDGGDFRDQAIVGIARFLERVWKQGEPRTTNREPRTGEKEKSSQALLHRTIKKVGEDIASLHYNTAISSLMICLRGMEEGGANKEQFETFLKLLAPFAPFMTEEIWRETLGHQTSIHRERWPSYDSSIIEEDTVTIALQINSRTRGTAAAPADISEAEATALALANEGVKAHLKGATPKKIVYVPGKLINLVM